MIRHCSLAMMLLTGTLLVYPLRAQQHETPSVSSAIQQQYNGIKSNLLAAANNMPEADYSFKPVPAERDFGQWVAHLADAQTSICSGITGERKNIHAASMTSKADLVNALKMSFDTCDAAYNALTAANVNDSVPLFRGMQPRLAVLAFNIAHDNEGYGSMAVYMRVKGLVPPSSEPRQGMRPGATD